MYKKFTIFFLTLLITSMTSCTPYGMRPIDDVDLVKVSYEAVDDLLDNLSQPIPKDSLIVVSTLVNANDLNQTSAFGRIVSDQIASAFNKAGYRIKGMEMQTAKFVTEEGGMLQLTDEAKETFRKNHVTAVVAGVFAAGRENAYVSLRMVDIASKNIISSTDFNVPMGPDARVLLRSQETGSALTGK